MGGVVTLTISTDKKTSRKSSPADKNIRVVETRDWGWRKSHFNFPFLDKTPILPFVTGNGCCWSYHSISLSQQRHLMFVANTTLSPDEVENSIIGEVIPPPLQDPMVPINLWENGKESDGWRSFTIPFRGCRRKPKILEFALCTHGFSSLAIKARSTEKASSFSFWEWVNSISPGKAQQCFSWNARCFCRIFVSLEKNCWT